MDIDHIRNSLKDVQSKYQSLATVDAQAFDETEGNQIEIIDTPHCWGTKFTDKKGVTKSAGEAKQRLSEILEHIVQNATETLDVVSLAPPDGEFYDVIVDNLKKRLDQSPSTLKLVRFLFGYLPGGEDTVGTFRTNLAGALDKRYTDSDVTLYVGRVHGGSKGGGGGPLSYWNHAKIVAADGRLALVGGHNLWPSGYGEYPPVHDISLFVQGPAAFSAQNFANFMWTLPGSKGGLVGSERARWTRYYRYDFKAGTFPGSNTRNPDRWERGTPTQAHEPDKLPFLAPKTFDLERTSTGADMLGVGRYPTDDSAVRAHGDLAGKVDGVYMSPSEHLKRLVISSADEELLISQQDLVFLGAKSADDSSVVNWVAEALYKQSKLVAKLVVSSINAKSRDGAQYSWGSGPLGTYEVLCDVIAKRYADKKDAILSRLHVAPFCFTSVNVTREGAGHSWPGTETYSWKHAQFSIRIPLPKLYSRGLPEPANHAKFYMSRSNGSGVYYVGSDNLYPHELFEFGYVVSDKTAFDTMYNEYWKNVWKYSGRNCVCDACRRSFLAVLQDARVEYQDTLSRSFRSPSTESQNAIKTIDKFLHSEDVTEFTAAFLVLRLLGQEDQWPHSLPAFASSNAMLIDSKLLGSRVVGKTLRGIVEDNLSKKRLSVDDASKVEKKKE